MKWINAKSNKPFVDKIDKIYKENDVSVRVLIWYGTFGSGFGRYYYKTGNWSIEGVHGLYDDKVTHFAYISVPKDVKINS